MEAEENLRKQIVASNLRRARQAAGISQEELGARIGVDRRQINQWECAHHEPRSRRLHEIAAALGVPLSYFYVEHPPEAEAAC